MESWPAERVHELKRLWNQHGGSVTKIGRAMGLTRGSVIGKSHRLGLHYVHGEQNRVTLASDHPAVVEGRTIFESRVFAPDGMVLKPGAFQRKLGSVITKGKWKGFPLYSLTLEERATCPRYCGLWSTCYGNNMNAAKRYDYGGSLEIEIWRELDRLQKRWPAGFVVRTHVLGDYYSLAYVDLWEAALDHFPALHVFGYTHRRFPDPIGKAIEKLRNTRWDRFAVRTSGQQYGPGALVVSDEHHAKGRVVCPAQIERSLDKKAVVCATCALCWSETFRRKPICFLKH